MKWKDISEKSRDIMSRLGGYTPVSNRKDARVMGWVCDVEKVYWSSEILREIAAAYIEVADWLDKRASENDGG